MVTVGLPSWLQRAREAEGVRLAAGFALVVAAEIWISFNAGGFFAGTTGIATVAVGLAVVLWLMSSRHPFGCLTPELGVAVAALTLFAVWTLCSQWWSDAPARAVIEFDRALLYAMVALLAGLAANGGRRRALLLAVGTATTAVCTCGLITRLLPDVWTVRVSVQPDRLSYPVTYWNTLGMIAVVGMIAALHVVSDERERTALRATAAAAVPLLFTTALLTFSRASLALLGVGVLLYLALARPRGAFAGLLAVVPAAALAGAAAYAKPGVVNGITDPRAIADGKVVAPIVLAAVLLAAASLVLARRYVEPRALVWKPRRSSVLRVAGVVLAVVVVGLIASDAPHQVSRGVSAFVNGDQVSDNGDVRTRLTSLGNNGHLEHWRVGLEVFGKHPLLGTGAGSYAESWARYRRETFDVNDGHSLLVEVLSELGVIGGVLIALALGAFVVGGVRRLRGPDRALHAALLTIVVLWAVRAQADWDWEMPALTAACIACGAALVGGRAAVPRDLAWPPPLPRLIASIGLLALLLTPMAVARSQHDIDAASSAFAAGDCRTAIARALDSIDALSSRPEPFGIVAFCDARLGQHQLALAAARAAVRRDPGAWRARYNLAVVEGMQGRDPRPELRRALQLNPLSWFLRRAIERFDATPGELWIERAGEQLPQL